MIYKIPTLRGGSPRYLEDDQYEVNITARLHPVSEELSVLPSLSTNLSNGWYQPVIPDLIMKRGRKVGVLLRLSAASPHSYICAPCLTYLRVAMAGQAYG